MSESSLSDATSPQPAAVEPAEVTPAATYPNLSLRLWCVLYLISGWVAAGLAWIQVESIIGTFPVVLILGLIVTWLAMRRTSWKLLCFGLTGVWGVAIVSLVIATFDIGPSQAVPTVPTLLTVSAVLLSWLFAGVARAVARRLDAYRATGPLLKFRVSTLMLVATVVCVLSALGKLMPLRGEMWFFASGGLALLGLSALVLIWFARRLQQPETTHPDDQEST